MALDQTIIDILNEQTRAFNQSQTRDVEARVSCSGADYGRFSFYDVLLFPRAALLSGEHVMRLSHNSPGPSFPVDIIFSDPSQPKSDVAASPEVLSERVREILAESR